MAIVYFRSKAAGEIFLMQDTAKAVFEAWGITHTDSDVILPEDLPGKLKILNELIARDDLECREAEELARSKCETEEEKEQVDIGRASYRIRLWPLKDMMERAIRRGVDIHWGF